MDYYNECFSPSVKKRIRIPGQYGLEKKGKFKYLHV